MAQVEQWMKDAAKAILHAGSWPDEWEQSDADEITDIIAAHAPSVAPPPRGEKRPIARPCSACGDGDTEMKYHDHFPPFADEPSAHSVAPPTIPVLTPEQEERWNLMVDDQYGEHWDFSEKDHVTLCAVNHILNEVRMRK